MNKAKKETLRTKKLKEVRKGKGAGRPFQARKKTAKTFMNPKTQQNLNTRRNNEMARLSSAFDVMGIDGDIAFRTGKVVPVSSCKFNDNMKTGINK
tara:strand:- start:2580 stop:2867 length:288 start_codon:yes stop_codon:yes gene_type:complete